MYWAHPRLLSSFALSAPTAPQPTAALHSPELPQLRHPPRLYALPSIASAARGGDIIAGVGRFGQVPAAASASPSIVGGSSLDVQPSEILLLGISWHHSSHHHPGRFASSSASSPIANLELRGRRHHGVSGAAVMSSRMYHHARCICIFADTLAPRQAVRGRCRSSGVLLASPSRANRSVD